MDAGEEFRKFRQENTERPLHPGGVIEAMVAAHECKDYAELVSLIKLGKLLKKEYEYGSKPFCTFRTIHVIEQAREILKK